MWSTPISWQPGKQAGKPVTGGKDNARLGGTRLRVDLSSGTIERQPLEEKLCNLFVGGRGISAKILFDEVPPEIMPLSPHNKLIFSCGPLSGTAAPSPARFHVTGKAPLTGIMGNSNAGGYFGPAMKNAGYDHIVIQGKAQEPVYLWINNDTVEIKSARHLWGKKIREAEAQIKEEWATEESGWPQSDRPVKTGKHCQHCPRRALRVTNGPWGSNGLQELRKPSPSEGTKEVKLFDPLAFNRLAKEMQQRIATIRQVRTFPQKRRLDRNIRHHKAGFLASRNFQQTGGFEGIENFNPKNVAPKFYLSNKPCFKCPIGCGKAIEGEDGPLRRGVGQQN